MPALYQRARPVRFEQVVGQEHVIEVLATAVRVGRIGHAYLLSGPRGVGKTTTARLLAMAANCEAEEAAQRPCGECESCQLVQSGAHPDVTELDAASNNSVEDVRDLREKVGLAGLRGGMRVWILDEAHMLSRAASNALLKTLEEPPPGLVFILATTEPEKLPPTILSRCQHFRFRRLSDEEIEGKLTSLCRAAEVDFDADALRLVARVADGGMRDAESMLERLLVREGGITEDAAEEALGLPPQTRLQDMATALALADLDALLREADALYRAGFSPRTLAEQLGRALRDALVGSVRGEGFRVALDDAALMRAIQALDDDMERFVRHNDLYALEVALIKALNAARGDLPRALDASAADVAGTGATGTGATGTGATGTAKTGTAKTGTAGSGTAASAGTRDATPPAGSREGAEGERTEPERTEPEGTAPEGTAPKSSERKGRERKSSQRKGSQRPTGSPAGSETGPAAESTAGAEDARSPADEGVAAARQSPADAPPAGGNAEPDRPPRSAPEAPPEGATDTGETVDAERAGTDEAPRKPLVWREVKAKAGPQLKAFLKPAKESLEGDVMRLRYDEVHRFHHGQLLERSDELAALVHVVAGPGYTVLVEGPEGGAPKKIA